MYIKRDDLTHPEIMGNKWRKLKYNLEEAKNQGKTTLITMGGAFSNHIAATAAAAHEFGFGSIGIIRGDELNEKSNATLEYANRKGMKLKFVDRTEFRKMREDPSLIQKPDDCYFLPEGGTNQLAIRGCKEITSEIKIGFDLIACPIGTGGTFCGILDSLSNNQRVLGVSSLKGNFIDAEIKTMCKTYEIDKDNYDLSKQYHFGGYGKTTTELIDFINWFKENFNVQLDPIYTGKCFFGVWDMVKKNKFEENLRIILLHTGGLQGIGGFNRKNQKIIQ